MTSDPRKRPLFKFGSPSAPAPTGPIATAVSSPAPIRPTQPAAPTPDTSFLQGPGQPAPAAPLRPAPARPPTPAAAPPPPETGRKGPPPVHSSLYLWLGLIAALLIIGALVHYFWTKPAASGNGTAVSAAHSGRHGGHGAGAGDTIRVVVATATKGDIGVYLTGLGAVTPLNTDTIQSRVNGQLMKVLFTEGQMVKAGRSARADRQPPLRGAARAIHRAKGARPGAARQREHRFAALPDSLEAGFHPEQTLATQESLVKQDQGTVDSDQALIDATKLNITYCNITAPISGRVGLRLVDVGNYVQSTSSQRAARHHADPAHHGDLHHSGGQHPAVMAQAQCRPARCRWKPTTAAT